MKYVRCVYDGFNGESIRLTIGKIYEVLEINYNKMAINSIHILDNLNTKSMLLYHM
jgi:hypothetical protein